MDLVWTVTAAGATISVVAAARAYTAVKLASIRASLGPTPQEFAMMEKAATKPRKAKAAKPEPVHPYGL